MMQSSLGHMPNLVTSTSEGPCLKRATHADAGMNAILHCSRNRAETHLTVQ
jgi:hypothetical protein